MPPRKERLTKKDFLGLKKRSVYRTDFFDVSYTEEKDNPTKPSKVGCVIAKKKVKNAVDRNKIKRKFYHIYSEKKPVKNYTVIFYPKPNCLRLNHENLKKEIFTFLATLH